MKKTIGIVAAMGLLAAGYRKRRRSRSPQPEARPGGMTVVRSHHDFETSAERLTLLLESLDEVSEVWSIDHAADSSESTVSLPPTRLILFTSPDLGATLMGTERTVALDLPFRFLVWQEDDEVWIGWSDPQYLAQRHGLESVSDVLDAVSTLFEELATSTADD